MAYKPLRDAKKEAIWREIVGRQKQSGLNQHEFCLREGLNENTFSSWKQIILKRDLEKGSGHRSKAKPKRESMTVEVKPESASPFVPVVFARSDQPETNIEPIAEIRMPGASVILYPGIDQDKIRSIMLAYRECWF